MHQACAGYADLTDLECMAPIPARAGAAAASSTVVECKEAENVGSVYAVEADQAAVAWAG